MTTPRIAMPEIAVGQAAKEIAHNDALRIIDALMSGRAISRTLATPPGSPVEGDVYIVPVSPAGAWSGQTGKIAHFYANAWYFYTAKTGMHLWSDSDKDIVYFDGSVWDLRKTRRISIAMTDANKTLTAIETSNEIIELTGTLTAQRNIVIPLTAQQYTVFNGTAGGFGLQFIGATGAGVVVANSKRAIVYANGTNVVRVSADV